MSAPLANIKYISVSELSRRLSLVLERSFPEVFFEGEIQELTRAASGHIYFTIKDERSQLSAVMWKGMAGTLGFVPKAGLAVVCHGKPNIYSASGRMQIVVHHMALAGEGLLQKKFLELKAKLEKEGLFDESRKRKIPFFPKALGVVTSPTGAVIHDIMVKIRERMPSLPVDLVGVRVQGEGAAKEIADAISYLNELNKVDVIIVARGGGSLEDLWAFNEEITVRAIFGSRIPIVCGVGHEVDITLADLAADLRAPTPTAAAEYVVPKRDELLKVLDDYQRRFSDFQRWLQPLAQRIDELDMRFSKSMRSMLANYKLRIQAVAAKVALIEPSKLMKLLRGRIDLLEGKIRAIGMSRLQKERQALLQSETKLQNMLKTFFNNKKHRLENLGTKLEMLSPKRIMASGYSIAELNGKIVASADNLKTGDKLKLVFHKGSAISKVEEVQG